MMLMTRRWMDGWMGGCRQSEVDLSLVEFFQSKPKTRSTELELASAFSNCPTEPAILPDRPPPFRSVPFAPGPLFSLLIRTSLFALTLSRILSNLS